MVPSPSRLLILPCSRLWFSALRDCFTFYILYSFVSWVLMSVGLFVGSSSCVNLCAAVHIARQLGPGHRIVTLLCDSGSRHLSKFYNDDWLKEQGIEVKERYDDLGFLDQLQETGNIMRDNRGE